MADPNNIFEDQDLINAVSGIDGVADALKRCADEFDRVPKAAKDGMTAVRDQFKKGLPPIKDITDAIGALGSNSAVYDFRDLIKYVREFSKSSKEAAVVLEKMGISGRFVHDELRKVEAGMEAAAKGTDKFRDALGVLDGTRIKTMLGLGALGTTLYSLADATAKYNKEIYNAVRAANVFGQSTKQARAGLQEMAKAVDLNEKSAAQFYQTWLKASNGMAPTTKQMTGFIRAIGDEFGNTSESINGVLGQVGKLQSMQIGIDMSFIERLQQGLVSTEDMMNKVAQLRVLDPAGAKEAILLMERFRTSANVDKETKSLKSMSDLMAYLRDTIDAFVAKNGEKLQGLIEAMVRLTTLLIGVMDKIPGPLLQMALGFKALQMLGKNILGQWKEIGSFIGNAAGMAKKMGFFQKAAGAVGGALGKDYSFFNRKGGQAEMLDEAAKMPGMESVIGPLQDQLKEKFANMGFIDKFKANIADLGGGMKGLTNYTKLLAKSFGPLLIAVAAAAISFKLVSSLMKRMNDKEKGTTYQAQRMQGYERTMKLQRSGNLEAARQERARTDQIGATSQVGAAAPIGMGAGVGAAVGGLGALAAGAMGASAAFPPLILVTGTVAGALAGLMGAANATAEANTMAYTAELTEYELTRAKNVLTEKEIALMQKRNAEDVKRMKEARFGKGMTANIKEFFVTEMPTLAGAIRSSMNFVLDVFEYIGGLATKAVEGIAKWYEFQAQVLGAIFGGAKIGDKKEGPLDYQMQLKKENIRIGEEMQGVQKDIEAENERIINLYAQGQIQAAREVEAQRDRLRAKYDVLDVRRKARELVMYDREFQKIASRRGREVALEQATIRARELLEIENDRDDLMGNINRQMDAATQKYENQRKILDQIYQAHLNVLDAMQLMGDVRGAEENLEGALKTVHQMGALATEYRQDMERFARALGNMAGDETMTPEQREQSGNEMVQQRIAKLQAEINDLEQQGTQEAAETLSVKRQQLANWEKMTTQAERNQNIQAIMAQARSEEAKATRQIFEAEQNVGKQFETNLAIRREEMSLGQAQLDMVKQFMGGIGLTYEMQMEQIGRVRATAEQVTNIIASRQQRLLQIEQQRNDAINAYNEAQAKGERGADEAREAQARINKLETARRAQNIQLMKAQQERLSLVKQEVELTKELRYGYLNAIQSQALAAGQFQKIIFTREQNLTEMLSMRTKQMQQMSAADQSQVNISEYNEMTGGRLSTRQAEDMRQAGPIAGRHTASGFESRFGAAQRGMWERGRMPQQFTAAEQLFPGRGMAGRGGVGPAAGMGQMGQMYGAAAMGPHHQGVAMEQQMQNLMEEPIRNMDRAQSDFLRGQEVAWRRQLMQSAQTRIPPTGNGTPGAQFGAGFSAQGQWGALTTPQGPPTALARPPSIPAGASRTLTAEDEKMFKLEQQRLKILKQIQDTVVKGEEGKKEAKKLAMQMRKIEEDELKLQIEILRRRGEAGDVQAKYDARALEAQAKFALAGEARLKAIDDYNEAAARGDQQGMQAAMKEVKRIDAYREKQKKAMHDIEVERFKEHEQAMAQQAERAQQQPASAQAAEGGAGGPTGEEQALQAQIDRLTERIGNTATTRRRFMSEQIVAQRSDQYGELRATGPEGEVESQRERDIREAEERIRQVDSYRERLQAERAELQRKLDESRGTEEFTQVSDAEIDANMQESTRRGTQEGARQGIIEGMQQARSGNMRFGGVAGYAQKGFPGAPKGSDTERFLLNRGDVVLNRKATDMFKHMMGARRTVSSSGGKVRGEGVLPYYLTPGEQVLSGKEASKIGYEKLALMNTLGRAKHAAEGDITDQNMINLMTGAEEIMGNPIALVTGQYNNPDLMAELFGDTFFSEGLRENDARIRAMNEEEERRGSSTRYGSELTSMQSMLLAYKLTGGRGEDFRNIFEQGQLAQGWGADRTTDAEEMWSEARRVKGKAQNEVEAIRERLGPGGGVTSPSEREKLEEQLHMYEGIMYGTAGVMRDYHDRAMDLRSSRRANAGEVVGYAAGGAITAFDKVREQQHQGVLDYRAKSNVDPYANVLNITPMGREEAITPPPNLISPRDRDISQYMGSQLIDVPKELQQRVMEAQLAEDIEGHRKLASMGDKERMSYKKAGFEEIQKKAGFGTTAEKEKHFLDFKHNQIMKKFGSSGVSYAATGNTKRLEDLLPFATKEDFSKLKNQVDILSGVGSAGGVKGTKGPRDRGTTADAGQQPAEQWFTPDPTNPVADRKIIQRPRSAIFQKEGMNFQNWQSTYGKIAGTQQQTSNNVAVGGVSIGYNYDSTKSREENDSNLIAATMNQVEKEMRGALKQKVKSRAGV